MSLNIDTNMILFSRITVSWIRIIFEFLSHDLERCLARTYANEIGLVTQWCRNCLWLSSGPTLQRPSSLMLRMQWRCYVVRTIQSLKIHVHQVVSRQPISRSNRDFFSQNMFATSCFREITLKTAASFVKSSSLARTVSINVIVLWFWWCNQNTLEYHILYSDKICANYNCSWTCSNCFAHRKW